MLGVVLLFIAASIFMPTLESSLVDGTDKLPFGLSGIHEIGSVALLGGGAADQLRDLRGDLPGGPQSAGAVAGDLARGALRHPRRRPRQLALPALPDNVSSLSRFGSTLGFVLIALLWFYLLSARDHGRRGDQLAALRALRDRRDALRAGAAAAQSLRRPDRRRERAQANRSSRPPGLKQSAACKNSRVLESTAASGMGLGMCRGRRRAARNANACSTRWSPAAPRRLTRGRRSPTSSPRAGVSRTTFYKCFEDKRDCFDAAIGYCLERLAGELAAAAALGRPTAAEAVRQATARCSSRWRRSRRWRGLLSADAVSVDPTVVERYRALVLPALEELWSAPPGGRCASTRAPGSPSAAPSC